MQIEVKFMASYSVISGVSRIMVDIPEKSTVNELIKVLSQKFENTPLDHDQTIVAVNGNVSPRDQILNDGEKVLIFHQMSGG